MLSNWREYRYLVSGITTWNTPRLGQCGSVNRSINATVQHLHMFPDNVGEKRMKSLSFGKKCWQLRQCCSHPDLFTPCIKGFYPHRSPSEKTNWNEIWKDSRFPDLFCFPNKSGIYISAQKKISHILSCNTILKCIVYPHLPHLKYDIKQNARNSMLLSPIKERNSSILLVISPYLEDVLSLEQGLHLLLPELVAGFLQWC